MSSILPGFDPSAEMNASQRNASPAARVKPDADLESNRSTTPVPSMMEDTAKMKMPPETKQKGWRQCVKSLGPVWFSIPMGTGVATLILTAVPWQGAWLYWIAVALFGLTAVTFVVVLIATIMRYWMYPECWSAMINDPTQTPFLGTFPIALATLVESWIFLCVPYWGYWAVVLAWILWMVDALIAISITIGLSYLLVSQPHIQDLARFTATQVLPISATVVASGAAAECAGILRNPNHAVGTMIAGYVMWSLSVPLAVILFTIYYQRLAIHKYPPSTIIVSSFVPLGPLGMGGFTIILLGKAARTMLPKVVLLQHVAVAGEVLYLFGIVTALTMWSFGLVWMSLAIAGVWRAIPFSFNMTWWGLTFPLGVFALSTMTLGVELPSMFFKVFGTIITVSDLLLWGLVCYHTTRGVWNGRLFHSN